MDVRVAGGGNVSRVDNVAP